MNDTGNVTTSTSFDKKSGNLPDKWLLIPNRKMKGGQATAVPVRHEDGREGIYRKLSVPSDISKQRFHRELEILTKKVRHQGIVTLYDWATETEQPWYISELGDPFDKWWVDCRRSLKPDPNGLVERAISILSDISSALSVCHKNEIVHRDIKPKNIIMKRGVSKTWPILIDFGIAHDETDSRLTPTDDAVSNARFSPDIMRTRLENVLPWLDVFDLGQLLIWMLDEKAPKNHWQRPVHWNYAVYSDGLHPDSQLAIKAFTAACSTQSTSPANGADVLVGSIPTKVQSAT